MFIYVLILLGAVGAQDLSIYNLTSTIAYVQYKGKWQSNQQFEQYDYLTEMQGDSYMIFITNSTSFFFRSSEAIIRYMNLQMLNPTYPEEKQVYALFELTNYTSQSWTSTTVMNYTGYYKFKEKINSNGDCMVDYLVQVTFQDQQQPSYENCQVSVIVRSKDFEVCQVDYSIQYTVDNTNYQLQVIMYCIFIDVLCAIQFICVTKMCKDFLEDHQDLQRISILTIGYITIYDACLCLQNLYFALLNYVIYLILNRKVFFQYFIIPAFFYLLLSATCDMKLLWIVWRTRYANELIDHQQQRKAVAIFFIQFYAALITLLILIYIFQLENWFICLTGFFIVPQIIHNAMRGNNPKFLPNYIFGVLAINMFQPLYFRGCPANFRGLQPSLIFCITWTSIFLLQIFILFIQFKFGPRSFIPKCLLPKPYNYLQEIKMSSVNGEEIDECAICLTSLLMEPDQTEQNLDQAFLSKKLMVTPCNHKFHIKCLREWMDVKLQCPTCRMVIPPINT